MQLCMSYYFSKLFFIELIFEKFERFSEDQSNTPKCTLTRVDGHPILMVPITEDMSQQLCSQLPMVLDIHKPCPQTSIESSNPQNQSAESSMQDNSRKQDDISEQDDSSNQDDSSKQDDSSTKQDDSSKHNDYKEIRMKLNNEYKKLDYPTVSDTVPKSFCSDVVLLDTNDINVPVLVSYDVFVDKLNEINRPQYVYMTGDNGTGKRMLLYHLAKEWAADHILRSFQFVYLILDEKLPSDLIEILRTSEDTLPILLLVYGLSWKKSRCFYTMVSDAQEFSNVKIVFAGDSKLDHSRLQRYDFYQIVGFSQIGQEKFIESSFAVPDDKLRWNKWIGDHPFASALCFRPLYCSMLIHLFKNHRLNDNIINMTSLYKEFLDCTILKNVTNKINFLSDMTGKDKEDFDTLLHFSHCYVQPSCSIVWDKSYKSNNHFGLISNCTTCSLLWPFTHPSIALFLAKKKDIWNSNSPHFSDCSDLYTIFFLTGKERVFSSSTFLGALCHTFEIQNPSLYNLYDGSLSGPEMFDPLNWFIYGWFINNNRNYEPNIPLELPQLRQLAIQMIYQSALHPTRSSVSPCCLTQRITGETEMTEMMESIKTKDQMMTSFVQEVSIAGNLGSSINDYSLNSVFPNVKILNIECKKWIMFFDSLSQLKYLQQLTIHIHPPFADSLPNDLPHLLKRSSSLKHLTLKSLTTNFLEALLKIFSEVPTIKSLESLTIAGSKAITSECFNNLNTMLIEKECSLKMLVFKDFSISVPSDLGLLMKSFLYCKSLDKVQLQGEGSIGDVCAMEMADAIVSNLPVKVDKILEVNDTSISGKTISRLITIVAGHKLSLHLPVKYKYDFHNIKNVSFIQEMPNLLLRNNILLRPP